MAQAGDVKHGFGVMARAVGKDDLASWQAAQGMTQRALENDQTGQIGKLVGFPKEVAGIIDFVFEKV